MNTSYQTAVNAVARWMEIATRIRELDPGLSADVVATVAAQLAQTAAIEEQTSVIKKLSSYDGASGYSYRQISSAIGRAA